MVILLASCGAPKKVIQYDIIADQYADSSNYSEAILQWNKYIETEKVKGVAPNPKAFAGLGKAYFSLKEYEKAEQNFDKARNENYSDPEMYLMMGERYRMIDNLSKEITTLEFYQKNFPLHKDSSKVLNRLFETSLESENWEQAESIWQRMDENSKNKEEYLHIYFTMNKKLGNNDKCDEIAKQLMKVNSVNIEALEWLGKKYFNKAEDRYQSSLAVYNKKKTSKTYKVLLKELDKSTLDYKEALKYFKPLWKMDNNKKYAVYLANIYARFDDKKKSQYYKKFVK